MTSAPANPDGIIRVDPIPLADRLSRVAGLLEAAAGELLG